MAAAGAVDAHLPPRSLAAAHISGPVFDVAWSPDGARFAWYDRHRFWMANRDGSHPRAFARPADRDCCGSLWWPRAQLLVYEDDFRVFRVTTGGHTSRPTLVSGGILWVDRHGTVGATISPRGPGALQLLGLRGRRWRRVVNSNGKVVLDQIPSFAPDGRTVVFARAFCDSTDSEATCAPAGIWRADVTTGETRQLLPEGSCPSWSNDGTKLLYLDTSGAFQLADADGADSSLLLSAVQSGPYSGPCSHDGVVPVWSHDSKYIAFDTFSRDDATLKVLPVGDPQAIRTYPQLGEVVQYAWSPNADTLLAVSLSRRAARCPGKFAHDTSLWSINAQTGKTHALHLCH
jgi:Tol biopolymer transport system component